MSTPKMDQLMQLAQQMQKGMQDLQKGLADKKVTGSAGAGDVKVEVIMNGQQIVEKVKIGQGAIDEGEEILSDLIAAAVNNAVDKVKALTKDAMVDIYKQTGMPFEEGEK